MSLRPLIEVTVLDIRSPAPRVREFLLARSDGQRLPEWEAGAHVEVHAGDAGTGPLVRHYSLLGATGGSLAVDDPRDCWRIAVQREAPGGGSDYLHGRVAVGSSLRVSAPQNQFALERRDRFSLLIAGGIGVTPIHAMTRSLLRRRRDFAVVYVGRHAADMVYRDELAALAGDRLQCHVSAERGRPDLPALLARQPEGTRVYVCGPQGLIDGVAQAAATLGWAPDRVRSERFGAGRQAGDRGFALQLRRSGRTLRVGAGQSILDVLGAAGVDVLADCRRGECGLCTQTVLEAGGPLSHRDVFLSAQERAEGRSLCVCVSRVQGEHLALDL